MIEHRIDLDVSAEVLSRTVSEAGTPTLKLAAQDYAGLQSSSDSNWQESVE
jgi:hypothetical protein